MERRLCPLLVLAGGGEVLAEDATRLRDYVAGATGRKKLALDTPPRLVIPDPRGTEPHDYPLFGIVAKEKASVTEAFDSCVALALLSEEEAARES